MHDTYPPVFLKIHYCISHFKRPFWTLKINWIYICTEIQTKYIWITLVKVLQHLVCCNGVTRVETLAKRDKIAREGVFTTLDAVNPSILKRQLDFFDRMRKVEQDDQWKKLGEIAKFVTTWQVIPWWKRAQEQNTFFLKLLKKMKNFSTIQKKEETYFPLYWKIIFFQSNSAQVVNSLKTRSDRKWNYY